MRTYELMLVVKPDLDDAGVSAVVTAVSDAVERGSGSVIGSGQLADKKGTIVPVPGEGWRTRRLAYTIDGYRDGYYVVVHFESEPGLVDQLERMLNIRDDVMRHLVIRVEDGTTPVYAEPAAVTADGAADEPLLSAPDEEDEESAAEEDFGVAATAADEVEAVPDVAVVGGEDDLDDDLDAADDDEGEEDDEVEDDEAEDDEAEDDRESA
jgi:small subunit ribosomal protein S6